MSRTFWVPFLFSVNANETWLVAYPILDDLIILYTSLFVKNFFRAILSFCQREWIRLATYLILYGLIIPSFLSLVKKKFLSFSFFFGMDFSLASLCLFHNCALYMHVHFIIIKRDIESKFYIPFKCLFKLITQWIQCITYT